MDIEKTLDKIDEELSWRKKEISDLWKFVSYISNSGTKSYEYRDIYYRSFILLLYAHLEGFIKNGGVKFLQYIENKDKTFNELKTNFYATYFKRQYEQKKNKIIDLLNDQSSKAIIYSSKIETNSNITYNQLLIIFDQLGISFGDFINTMNVLLKDRINSFFGIKENLIFFLKDENGNKIELVKDGNEKPISDFIQEIDYEESMKNILDNNLLEKRNGIAHGEKREIELQYLDGLSDIVIILLDSFKELYVDYIINEKFLKSE